MCVVFSEIIFCFSSLRFEFSCIFYVIFQYYEHFQMSSVWIDFVNTLGMLVTIVWWMQIIFSEVFVRHRTFSHLEERKNVYKKYFLCTTYAMKILCWHLGDTSTCILSYMWLIINGFWLCLKCSEWMSHSTRYSNWE